MMEYRLNTYIQQLYTRLNDDCVTDAVYCMIAVRDELISRLRVCAYTGCFVTCGTHFGS